VRSSQSRLISQAPQLDDSGLNQVQRIVYRERVVTLTPNLSHCKGNVVASFYDILPQFAAGVKRLKALKIFQILNFRQYASRPDLRRFCSARFRNARICRRI